MKRHLMLLPLFCLSFLSGCNNHKDIEKLYREQVTTFYKEMEITKVNDGYLVYTSYDSDKKTYIMVYLYNGETFIEVGYKEINK